MTADPSDRPSEPPVLRVLSGDPSPEELAVITAILAAAARPRPDDRVVAPAASSWAAHWRQVRPPVRPGPGAWRASAGTW